MLFKTYLEFLQESSKINSSTKDEKYNGWNLRYQVSLKKGETELQGIAIHLKSSKTPVIKSSGKTTSEVIQNLKNSIASYKGNLEITSKTVIVDFNVNMTKDIIGHSDKIYANIVKDNGKLLLLISDKQTNDLKSSIDRRATAQKSDNTIGMHSFSMSGKLANSIGLTHARYTVGKSVNYGDGISAYELEFNSEVHPGEKITLAQPGVTIAYPRG